MGNGYLWLLSADGVPYRVTAESKIEHISDAQWKPEPVIISGEKIKVCQIAATPYAAFALDSSGAVYQFVLRSHLTIRQKVEIYANQRWYPMLGWSSRTLPTDRASFSNEDGSKSGGMAGFQLKSDGWRWEEPWIVDMDVRKHDKEGWEYATNFVGAVWKSENGVSTFVRRRRLKRHMRYTSLEKWAELPRSNNVLVELTAGGFDLLQEKQCLLFVLCKNGNLLRRVGIHANNPDGDGWHAIDGAITDGEREEFSKICCSPSLGTLIASTWDGRMFVRHGITRDTPDGVSWSPLATPSCHPVAFVTVGRNSMWTTSVDGKLRIKELEYPHNFHDPSTFSTSNYSIVGEGIYGMCLNGRDQLVAMSDFGAVYVREGISSAEPAGTVFLRIVERTSSEPQKWLMVTNAGTNYTSLPKHWINEHVVMVNTSHYRDAKWRKQILNDLCIVNDAYWEAFKLMNNDLEDMMQEEVQGDTWSRNIRAKLRVHGERRFMTGMLHLSHDQLMFQSSAGSIVSKFLQELTSSVRDYDFGTSTFVVRASFCEESLELGFSEESVRDESHELLQQEASANIGYPPSLCIPGCMKSVSAGAEGVVWSLAKDGAVYALSPDYSPVSGNVTNLALPQKTEILREVTEYQRHAFMRGFVTFQGTSNGIAAWMEGNDPVNGLYDKLPSHEWSWVDREWKLAGEDKSEGGWTYSEKIDDKYTLEKKRKDRVRRRVWQRRCLYMGRGPWAMVESPPIRYVEVQKTNSDRILVWAVTVEGQVLLRQGVTPGHPQGATWKHITSDYNITSISIASPLCVWATTDEGRLLRRECTEQTDMECIDWSEVVYSNMKSIFSFCASKTYVFLLPTSDPELTIIDMKRELSKTSISLPKAVHIALDLQDNPYYCDGSCIFKLEQSSTLNFYVSGKFVIPGCVQFCFTS